MCWCIGSRAVLKRTLSAYFSARYYNNEQLLTAIIMRKRHKVGTDIFVLKAI